MSQTRDDIPVLMLHGFLGCKDDWHDVAQRLQSGRRLAVFDLLPKTRRGGFSGAGRNRSRHGKRAEGNRCDQGQRPTR